MTLSCLKESTRYSLSYCFKDYRNFALKLSQEGVNIGVIGEEESESTSTTSSANAAAVKSVSVATSASSVESAELPLPLFPKTYTRSAFGFKLGEAELQERAEGLDRWVRALLQRYQLYSGVVQVSLLFCLHPFSSTLTSPSPSPRL